MPKTLWKKAMFQQLGVAAISSLALTSANSEPYPIAGKSQSHKIEIGVYYFPGWSPGMHGPDPWAPIRSYPGRIPLIGPYEDNSSRVLRRQLDEMKFAGLSFVVFDTYYGLNGSPRMDQAIKAYLSVATINDVQFSILWANHDNNLRSMADWDKIVAGWLQHYFFDSRYQHFDGRPLVFIFSAENLSKRAEAFGSSASALLARAQDSAQSAGLPGIAFVAGGGPRPDLLKYSKYQGYAALSDYNMGTAEYPMDGTGYTRREAVYRKYWTAYQRSNIPVILPMTVGWDKSPWGGSREDGALATPQQFSDHLRDAFKIISAGTSQSTRMGVICCWNEFGEGSMLEPTKEFGDQYIRVLRTNIEDITPKKYNVPQ